MHYGKRLLLHSAQQPTAAGLAEAAASWGCMTTVCRSPDELRAQLEGGAFDLVLVEPATSLQQLLAESSLEGTLGLTLAELEKRHILRVLASTGGNKTRAARSLGIDTKTLYNKLKSYQSGGAAAARRAPGPGSLSTR
ncbi:MAG: helix-turn-helix domain-containing protein [Planctomycetes bacterium]|nr:helix-turn-helix domain-containing protein [Planctomycetota bacterium]